MNRKNNIRSLYIVTLLFCILVLPCRNLPAQGPEEKGYLYLSPVPDAPYVSQNTQFILVRFTDISPADLTNMESFITVTGTSSGNHSGTAKIAGDNRTVIFEINGIFYPNELVTVSLEPETAPLSRLSNPILTGLQSHPP